MRLLVDMNLTPRWVQYFIEAGHTSCHWSTVGHIDAPDSEICQIALAQDFVLVTTTLISPESCAHGTREAERNPA